MRAPTSHPQTDPARQLCREDLANGSLREAFLRTELAGVAWSDAQLRRSLSATRAAGPTGDVWVFAYGSLIWNPIFPYAERRLATIYGLHRSFCLWSRVGRGTPQRPGLVLGLDRGGHCRGLAYRIAAGHVDEELFLLWRREMVTGSYVPTWVRARTPAGRVRAIAFVIDHESPAYAGRMAAPETARRIARAAGLNGPCSEYLVRTLSGLREHGIEDTSLIEIEREMGAHLL